MVTYVIIVLNFEPSDHSTAIEKNKIPFYIVGNVQPFSLEDVRKQGKISDFFLYEFRLLNQKLETIQPFHIHISSILSTFHKIMKFPIFFQFLNPSMQIIENCHMFYVCLIHVQVPPNFQISSVFYVIHDHQNLGLEFKDP